MEPPPPPPPTAGVNASEVEIPPCVYVNVGSAGSEIEPPNGVLNRHPRPTSLIVPYGKCNRNQSTISGVHALDGCKEFVPTHGSTPTDSMHMHCDACGCHRNFHQENEHIYSVRYETKYQHSPPSAIPMNNNIPNSPSSLSPSLSPSPSPLLSPSPISSYPSIKDLHFSVNKSLHQLIANQHGKRRPRTKFSEYQKQSMWACAERIGWTISNKDEEMVLRFCMNIGVSKHVFKVWMRNHKNQIVKSNQPEQGGNSSIK
ncbi:zinc-finger homeodomain protein 12-like [Bidens hawaiensis]|uniref:zinc-finger homeodomain protein 12-like n=1 Tax=Bidens hawaiensis TaxID=980011 RepID=UPI00404B6341